jgi:hypothetical protein
MSDHANPPGLAAAPCGATPDINEQLQHIRETQHEIRAALIGNPALGHKGLVHRVESIEAKVETHDRKILVWSAGITAALAALELLKDKIFNSH